PREKLERAGAQSLGDNELLAVVVGHGTARNDALVVANRLLSSAGGLHGLVQLESEEMARVPGVGGAVASRVRAALELGRRSLQRQPPARLLVQKPEDAASVLVPQYGAHPVERFGVLLLDTRHRLIRVRLLSTGSLDTSLAHPREVFREAVAARAAAIVVFHNHPSGDLTPSRDDVELTNRLVHAGWLLGIEVVDHLIITERHYCSLIDRRRR
ncbi:MAG TPA: DNA repair protein RadC, partial [Dongiaceae bacterium]|nr:DNA repair protein RadC [Dongiaceae bacterium]